MSLRHHDARTRATLERFRDHVNPSLAKLARFSFCDHVEWRGEGATVYDVDGRAYLDCVGSFGALSAGHAHPRIVAAVQEQAARLGLSTKLLLNEPMAYLAAELAEIAPGELQYCFFVNSGTEAVEAALKFARLKSGRHRVVSAVGGFHGKTLGALSASGRKLYRDPFLPLLDGFVQVPFGDLDALRAALRDDVGAVLLEPIQGEGGVIVPPPGYLRAVRALTRERGVLLIVDEVQTGLGRTGRTFAVEEEDVAPDLLVLAKALGGGVMPIGAVLGTPEVWEPLVRNPTLHSTTFGGNPLACAAARTFLAVLRDERLAERAARHGAVLMAGLERIAEEHPEVIAEVRGRGLLIGVELSDVQFTAELVAELNRRSILTFYTVNNERVLRIEPPLVVGEDQIRFLLDGFAAAVERVAPVALAVRDAALAAKEAR